MSIAWAQTAAAGSQMSVIMSYAPIVLIIGIFYMLVMRPQAAAAKMREDMLKALAKGQTVVLQAGFIGTITAINDKTGLLEIALQPAQTTVLVERSAIERLADTKIPAPATSSSKKKI